MSRTMVLILVLLAPQSAGWFLAGCRALTGGCGEVGSCCAAGGCGCADSESAQGPGSDRSSMALREGESCGPAGCDPRCCIELLRGVPLFRSSERDTKDTGGLQAKQATSAPAWVALVMPSRRAVTYATGMWLDPPPEGGPTLRARLCVWTI